MVSLVKDRGISYDSLEQIEADQTSILFRRRLPLMFNAMRKSTAVPFDVIRSGISPSTPLPFAPSPAKLNCDITIAGFPLHGLLGGLNVSRGAVSSLKGLGGTEATMQITAPVQPGNSGGPAVNRQGAVVGVVVAKLDALLVAREIGDIPENLGFAVRGQISQLFLASNDVDYETSLGGEPLSGEELAERLQRSTVLVECKR